MGLINWDAFAEPLRRWFYGHRQGETDTGSPTGAVQAPPPGERPKGTEPPETPRAVPGPVPIAQEILAWRGWHLSKDKEGHARLTSLAHGVAWDGPRLIADAIPTNNNNNGVYALMKGTEHYEHYRQEASVWGSVALSGIVIDGERGYRAEQAVIRSLTIRRHPEELRDIIMLEIACALEDCYQCSVELDSDSIWAETPERKFFPGQQFYVSATTQFPGQAMFQNQYLSNMSGLGNYGAVLGGLGSLGGGRRR